MTAKNKKPRRLARDEVRALDNAERAIADLKTKSQQPRFDPKIEDIYVNTMRWAKNAFETIPEYSSESRVRSQWLNKFWTNEPYLAGVINSVVQIDRNRGWSLVGGRNQVLRFTDILHNWQVQSGRAAWRDGISAMAQSFYTTDMGGLVEVGRQFKSGPLAGLFHLDPTRCVLTSKAEYPLKYFPTRATKDGKRVIEFAPDDYMRVVSATNIDERYNGLGYCALSRAIELAITMVAVWRHEQEMLFARAPKGLLLLKGINQTTWDNAMTVRDAKLESKQQEWFGAVAVLASAGEADVEAKLVALSSLPEGFDQQTFTDLLIYGYALCFGYDPREFWPVSSGSFGTVSETEKQHRSATAKGGKEFVLGLQEELQGNMPDTLHFEFDERDVDGDMSEALLQQAQIKVINDMGTLLTDEQKRILLAEQGIISDAWTVGEDDVEATDTEDADSPENASADELPATGDATPPPADTQSQMLELPEVQRAIQRFPNEPIIIYRWNGRKGKGRCRELSRNLKINPAYYSIPKFLRHLVKKYEHDNQA